MCADMIIEEHEIEAANAAVVSGKLLQICNGFAYSDGPPVPMHHAKSDCLRGIGDKQTLIVYTFLEDLARLREIFPDGRELRDDDRAIADWSSGALQWLFIHPKSGGHGLNLQLSNCSEVLFYGPLWSRDQTDQVIGRVRRRGNQAEVVRVRTLVMFDTVEDQVMMPRVGAKGEMAALFRDHLKSRT